MRFTLNGKNRKANPGETVLEAARRDGIEIPSPCMDDSLEPYGACRLCVVEAREKGRKRWRIVASCLYPLSDGLEVRTDTERIRRYRRQLLELMLARSSKTPYVIELARTYGVKRTRFSKGNNDCILCGLCVRVCHEVIGADAIGFSQRGIDRRVEEPFGIDASRCIACGACTYICPTDCITMEYKRVIELRRSEGEHLCRYAMMGLLSDAVCPLNYECYRCEIDQKMWEEAGTHPAFGKKAGKMRIRFNK